jgi:hypothetical protein
LENNGFWYAELDQRSRQFPFVERRFGFLRLVSLSPPIVSIAQNNGHLRTEAQLTVVRDPEAASLLPLQPVTIRFECNF